VFLQIRSTYLFEINTDYLNFETPNLKELLLSQRETMFLKLLLLTQMVVCGEIRVFPQLSSIGLFGRKLAFLHLESYDFVEIFLAQTNSIVPGQQCDRCPACQTDGVLPEILVFLQLTRICLFGTK
jgi:hypothetical protein